MKLNCKAINWQAADSFVLGPDDVHIWWLSVRRSHDDQRLQGLLAKDEQLRAARYVFAKDRQAFVTARAGLRIILARYLGTEPELIRFAYGRHGKPKLHDKEKEHRKLHFNLSHSGDYAAYAISHRLAVGIDIEYIRAVPDLDELAARTFSLGEQKRLLSTHVNQREAAFFNCWTRKEAFIKAVGDGMAFPLDQFEVTLDAGKPAKLLSVHGDSKAARHWWLSDLSIDPGYAAAVAVRGRNVCMSVRDGAAFFKANSLTTP